MKILITGATGFIGKNAYEYLGKRYKVFAPSHSEFDLLDTESVLNYVKRNNIDVVLHCASRGGGRDAIGANRIVEDNLRMFLNILNISKEVERIIYYGSGAEFDKSRDIRKIKEEQFGERIPKDDYGFFKYMCNIYTRKSENITNLRVFGTYGKYEHYEYRFISNAIVKNLIGMEITINQNVIFDFLYILDLMKITEYFINNEAEYKDYNITPTKSIDLLEACNIINSIADKKSKIRVLNPGLNLEYTGDNSRLVKELGDYDFMSYAEAIADLYKYYENEIGKIDTELVAKDPYLKGCKTKK